jgi:hypothetical protein
MFQVRTTRNGEEQQVKSSQAITFTLRLHYICNRYSHLGKRALVNGKDMLPGCEAQDATEIVVQDS